MPNSFIKSVAPLHLVLETSAWLRHLVIATHLAAGLASLSTPFGIPVKLILFAILVLHFRWTWGRLESVRGLTLGGEGEWEIILDTGVLSAQIEPSTVVTPWIVILHARSGRRKLYIPVCRDAVDPESFRRLRVSLRIAGHTIADHTVEP